MSVPKYIVNLPELEELIKEAITGGQDITSKIQKSIGFMIESEPYETNEVKWTPDEDIGIIGVRFGQEDIRNMGYLDNFDLVVESVIDEEDVEEMPDEESLTDIVIENVYHKELNEYKDFRVPYVVAEGSNIRIINKNETGIGKEVKFDIDYIEAVIPQKELIILCIDVDTGEVIKRVTSFHDPVFSGTINPPEVEWYKPVSPPKDVFIGVNTSSPKTIKFYYEDLGIVIDHLYDWKLVLRWESSVDTDLDFHASYGDTEIYYGNREDTEEDDDGELIEGVWLDHDFTHHKGPNDRVERPEIMTVLGNVAGEIRFFVRNYRGGQRLTEKVTVDIYKQNNRGEDVIVKSIEKPAHLFHERKAVVDIARINLDTEKITIL